MAREKKSTFRVNHKIAGDPIDQPRSELGMFDENNRRLDITPNALGNVLSQNKSKFRKVGMVNGCFLWGAVEVTA